MLVIVSKHTMKTGGMAQGILRRCNITMLALTLLLLLGSSTSFVIPTRRNGAAVIQLLKEKQVPDLSSDPVSTTSSPHTRKQRRKLKNSAAARAAVAMQLSNKASETEEEVNPMMEVVDEFLFDTDNIDLDDHSDSFVESDKNEKIIDFLSPTVNGDDTDHALLLTGDNLELLFSETLPKERRDIDTSSVEVEDDASLHREEQRKEDDIYMQLAIDLALSEYVLIASRCIRLFSPPFVQEHYVSKANRGNLCHSHFSVVVNAVNGPHSPIPMLELFLSRSMERSLGRDARTTKQRQFGPVWKTQAYTLPLSLNGACHGPAILPCGNPWPSRRYM
jgi:hypothetical protein